MTNEEHMATKPISKGRRQKSTQERLEDKLKQLAKATENLETLQKRVKSLKDDIAILESKRQQEIMQEYGVDLGELEAILAHHNDEKGGDA